MVKITFVEFKINSMFNFAGSNAFFIILKLTLKE